MNTNIDDMKVWSVFADNFEVNSYILTKHNAEKMLCELKIDPQYSGMDLYIYPLYYDGADTISYNEQPYCK